MRMRAGWDRVRFASPRAGHKPIAVEDRTAWKPARSRVCLGFFSLSGRFLEIGDEGILKRSAAALLDQRLRSADGKHPPLVHQRNTVAAIGLVHEMGRKEDGDPIIAGEIDQRAPERVASDRIDA